MSDDQINPNFRTKFEDFSGEEKAKLATKGLTFIPPDINSTVNLPYQFRDISTPHRSADLGGGVDSLSEEAESLAKSYGIYLEFNRARTGTEREWMYMFRISIPGGGPITPEQWVILDDLSENYTTNPEGKPSLRITTRQNIQFHWVRKKNLIDVVRDIGKSRFFTINGCGDNTRNVMGCPLSNFSKIYNANALARKIGEYFRLPTAAYIEVFQIDPTYLRDPEERFQYGENLLNRKFKLAFSAIHYDPKKGRYVPDNCVELRTNDIGIAPLLEDGRVSRFQVYIGGSQGEKNGRPTFSAMGEPLGIFRETELLKGLDAIVQTQQEWGDRQRRYWARMKYILMKQGMEWFQQQVRDTSGIDFDMPDQTHDYGDRNLHSAWIEQESNGLYTCGVYIENGRIIDGPDGKLKKMARYLMDNYPIILFTTPNQDLLFSNVPEEMRGRFEEDMKRFGYGSRNGKSYSTLRLLSGACVGRDTCRLTYTDSEKFEPFLLDELEVKWGGMAESIGITGCERQCFRPATKTIGWVGSAFNMYQLKLMGTEDGRHQGRHLKDPKTGEIYLRMVKRQDVGMITDVLFEFYTANRLPDESRPGGMGYFHSRIGMEAIISHLKENPRTAKLMKPMKVVVNTRL